MDQWTSKSSNLIIKKIIWLNSVSSDKNHVEEFDKF